jgi:membrane-bound lytic murein transglycosylase B
MGAGCTGMLKSSVVVAIGLAVALGPSGVSTSVPPGTSPPFATWRVALVEEAVDRGFERAFVEAALGNMQPLPQVVQLDRTQSQAPQSLDAYLAARVTPELETRGRTMVRRYSATFDRIQHQFGVQGRFVAAIWGAETGYGAYAGNIPVLQALVTLAWEPRRAPYFRGELFNALRILQDPHMNGRVIDGSWAGPWASRSSCRPATLNMPSISTETAIPISGILCQMRSHRSEII